MIFLLSLPLVNDLKTRDMGKGDLRTKKGKRVRGSFGKTRQRKHTPAYAGNESGDEKEVEVMEADAAPVEKKAPKAVKPKAAKEKKESKPEAKDVKEKKEAKAEAKTVKEEKESKAKKKDAPEVEAKVEEAAEETVAEEKEEKEEKATE